MDTFKKHHLVYRLGEKLINFLKPLFDNSSSQTMEEVKLEKYLTPNLIKIKK